MQPGLSAFSNSADLLWEWDLGTDKVKWQSTLEGQRSFEMPIESSIADWERRVHPDEARRVRAQVARSIATGDPLLCEYRLQKADGSFATVLGRGFVIRDDQGAPVRMLGSIQPESAGDGLRNTLFQREVELEQQRSLLQTVVDSVDDLIFAKDLEGTFILSNRALQQGCGITVGHRTRDLFNDDLTDGYEGADRQVIESGAAVTVDEIIPIGGERRMFQTVKVPWLAEGGIKGVIGVSRDITARQAADSALRRSEALHRSILEASADAIAVLSLEGKLELINSSGARALDLGKGGPPVGVEWLSLWPKRVRGRMEAALVQGCRGDISRLNIKRPSLSGEPTWWDVVITPIKDNTGAPERLLSICRDVTRSKAASEMLKWSSEHDSLTGLANRGAFQARLQAAALRSMEHRSSFGLLLLDLDHFKHINDSFGHAAGDELLQAVAHRVRSAIRANDFAARLGGDEFAIIIEDVPEDGVLHRAGDSIAKRLNASMPLANRTISAGVSIGGAIFPRDGATALEIFNAADTALYALKSSGRGGLRMFQSELRKQAQQVASQLSLARAALDEHSVVPHFQPKVDLRTGALVGYEALLRWMHPSRGLQPPSTVQEAFKDYELATKIGELMQRGVISAMREWLRQGVQFGRIAINAAPAEFLRDDYAERLLSMLASSNVDPRMLEVEVTEHVFLERGSELVARALTRLNDAGIRIALDDFGTGYSSLSHLRDLPVDVVKIDRSFVERMVEEQEISAIISAVVSLAQSLSLEVVAEGVETEAQRLCLLEKGCSHAQGFFYGRPMIFDAIISASKPAQAA
jgi:diguanylate cyclase (GGDEF)-like protein/PAS domain S-box-containing protein